MNYERRRFWRSGSPRSPFPPPYSFNQQAPQHTCSLCGELRSPRYQERNPIAPGQTPKPGICSRRKCAKAVTDMQLAKSPCPGMVVYEIHHHYHISSSAEASSPTNGTAELSGESTVAGLTELPGDSMYVPYMERYGTGYLSLRQGESPPAVNFSNKPTLRGRVF
jgi:hypothetical protein